MKKLIAKILTIIMILCLLLSGCGQDKRMAFSLEEQFDPETMSFSAAPWKSRLPEVYKGFGIEAPDPMIAFGGISYAAIVPVTLTGLNASGQMMLRFEEVGHMLKLYGVAFELSFADEAAENAFWTEYEALVAQWAEQNSVLQGYSDGESNYSQSFTNDMGWKLSIGHTGWEISDDDMAFARGGKRMVRLQFSLDTDNGGRVR